MRRILLATLLLGLGTSAASAQLALNGSDTLFDFTKQLMTQCGTDPAKISYLGGGSGLGESNMTNGSQQIAPMSRTLSGSANILTGQSQGCKVALDAIGILADNNEPNNCNTAVYSAHMQVDPASNGVPGFDDGKGTASCVDCVDGDNDGTVDEYVFTDWREVLRIVYGGQTEHRVVPSACTEATIARTAIGTQACNSDVRNTLVNNWEHLFQEGSGCNGTDPDACTQLRHAFRRDDASGTTDLFLETIGLPKISTTVTSGTSKPFCNGAEQEDEDPIRRNCSEVNLDGDEQVCNSVARSSLGPTNNSPDNTTSQIGWRGGPTSNPPDANSADLGLVLSVVIPPTGPYQDTTACSTAPLGGSFRYAPMPPAALQSQQKCPDGNKRVGGQCQWPARKVGTSFLFGCVNKKRNLPGARLIANMDGRVYNMIPRNADGSMQTVERVVGTLLTAIQVPVHHAIYRLHETTVMPGGVATTGGGCQFVDATDQIGCLVHASPCSIGYAGLGADLRDPNKVLSLAMPSTLNCANDGIDNNGIGGVDEAGELCGGLSKGATIRVCDTDGLDNNGTGGVDEAGEPCGAVQPTDEAVRRLNDDVATCGNYASSHFDERYPLSRNLFFNSRKGFTTLGTPYAFDNITNGNDEQKLVRCACDRFYADSLASTFGFVPLTTLTAGQCTAPLQHGVCDAPIRQY
jgi:hypothetical protein